MYGACPTHRIRPHPCRSRAQSQDKATQAAHREEEDDDDDDWAFCVYLFVTRTPQLSGSTISSSRDRTHACVFSLYYQQ
jgi:hypothetical protein